MYKNITAMRVRTRNLTTTVCLKKLPSRLFSISLFFLIQLFSFFFLLCFFFFAIFIFAAFAMTALEETEYIRAALRDFAKLTGINFFFYKESAFTFSVESIVSFSKKQNWPLQWKNKSLLFLPSSACRSDRIWFAFIWRHLPDRRVSGKTPRADHTWENPPRLS